MQGNVNIPDSTITTNLSFRQLVLMNMQQLTNFPYIEKDFDALTDYELLCLVVKYLNDVIANQNEQNDSITRMYESFLALQTYVNNTKDTLEDAFNALDDYVRNYFDNLDVQDEINNKLDEMLEDGVLEQIIEQFLQSTAIWCFDTVADMKAATNLINGSDARTLGYYSINDGGGALYHITNTESQTDFQEELSSGLYATLIHTPNYINVKTIGCKIDDNTFDNSTIINSAIKERTTLFFPYGEYFIANPIVITKNHVTIKGENERTRITKTTSNGTNITIETSKGDAYNLNNYDMCFYIGKETSASGTVSQVKIKDLSIQGFDPTETTHNIIMIGCGYFKSENLQLLNYNKAILIDDSFACNFDYIKALTFEGNRTAIEVKKSTAIYISNSYLNARYYSINCTGSRVYVNNVACDAHGYVFLITNESYFDMINSRCETYANIINIDNSFANISNCDLEGHGDTFEQILKANHSAKINIKNSLIRYRVYEGETPLASINGFRSENNSIVNIESYINKSDTTNIVNYTTTNGSLFITDLNIDGKKGDVTPETNVSFTEKEIYVKDGYVHVYLAGSKSDYLTQNSSTKVATLSGVPFPITHAHRGILGVSGDNIYNTYNPAYVGINTSGELTITTTDANQRYFVVNLCYKIKEL